MAKTESTRDAESADMRERAVDGVRDLSLLANWRVLLYTLYLGMALFVYGYDKGAIAGFQAMPGFLEVFGYKTPEGTWAIASTPQSIISSFMTLGALVGALLTGPIGAYLNRRHSIVFASLILIAAVAIMSETTSFGALYFSRLLCGAANGVMLNFCLVYLQEIAPPHLRGLCFGVATFWITLGTTIGMVVNNETESIHSRKAYQIPLYVCFPVPALLALSLPFMPESPRWLINHGKPEQALKSLRFFRKGAYDEVAVQQEFEEMKLVAAREAETSSDWRLILELFKGTNLRRTIVCVAVCTVNAGVGAMFILSFGTYFLKNAQVGDPFMWTIITNCFGLFGLILTWFAARRVGPRRLILVGCAICSFSMLVIAAVYSGNLSIHQSGVGLLVGMSFYLFAFNFGLEPYTFLTAGELPAQNLRGYTMGLSVGVSFIAAWLCTFTAPYFINPAEMNWGPKYSYIWFASGLISLVFVYFFLPDVNGRSLEEIDEMFRNKIPARAFKKYVCVEIEQAHERGALNVLASEKEAQRTEDEHVENAS